MTENRNNQYSYSYLPRFTRKTSIHDIKNSQKVKHNIKKIDFSEVLLIPNPTNEFLV